MTKPVKFAFVSDAVLPFHKGGKETRLYYFSRELARMGHDVHIYTMKWWDKGDTFKKDGVTYHALSKLYPLYVGDRRSIKEGLVFGLSCLKLIFYDFDILEVDHMPYFPLFSAKVVCLIKRKQLYATWHEVVGWKAWTEYMGEGLGTIAYIVEKLSVKLPDHIVAVSRLTKKQLRKVLKYRGELSLIQNGIDYSSIDPVIPSTNKSDILYTGRLIPHKNVDLLVHSIALLREEMPDIQCVIIGDGPEFANIQKIIAELGLEKNIVMTGRVESSDDIYALMKVSKVFALPSTREGFGITILEAYACGLRVVTVKHPNNAAQYLVKSGSGIVCRPTSEDIAKAIKTLLENSMEQTAEFDGAAVDWARNASALKEAYGL